MGNLFFLGNCQGVPLRDFDFSNVLTNTAGGRSGPYGYSFTTAAYGQKNHAAVSELFSQLAFMYTATEPTSVLLRVRNGTTTILEVRYNAATHVYDFYVGGTVLIGSTTTPMPGTWNWQVLEFYLKIADSDGRVIAKVDGNVEIDFTGDTKPGADTTVDNHYYVRTGGLWNVDDLVANDPTGIVNNSWPGGARVLYLPPKTDVSPNEWTPSSGTDHYAVVDEVPVVATDNLQANAIDQVEALGGFDPLPGEIGTVLAVKVAGLGLKGSTNPPQTAKLGLRKGGDDYYSGDKSFGTSQTKVAHTFELDPVDSMPWTVGKLADITALLVKSAT